MPFPIDLQRIMARTQILVKNSDFFSNGLILVIHIIYQLLMMIWKLLHHLKHPSAPTGHNGVWPQGEGRQGRTVRPHRHLPGQDGKWGAQNGPPGELL